MAFSRFYGRTIPPWRRYGGGLVFLTRFAVDTRYPGGYATKRQAVAALRWAEQARAAARALLGLRPPRRSK